MDINLEFIKNVIEEIALKHKDVKSFDYGDQWMSSVDGDGELSYPKIFFETPIQGTVDRKIKQYSFGLVCFIYSQEVYIKENHFSDVSRASLILDEIITKIDQDYKNKMLINFPYNTLSFTTETTSMLNGVRVDLIVSINNTCKIQDKFN